MTPLQILRILHKEVDVFKKFIKHHWHALTWPNSSSQLLFVFPSLHPSAAGKHCWVGSSRSTQLLKTQNMQKFESMLYSKSLIFPGSNVESFSVFRNVTLINSYLESTTERMDKWRNLSLEIKKYTKTANITLKKLSNFQNGFIGTQYLLASKKFRIDHQIPVNTH